MAINLAFDFDDKREPKAKLKVVGVGGAGGNAVNRMINEGLIGVEFIGVNTDDQALEMCNAQTLITIGAKTTHGLGAGADPERGRRAIEEDRNNVYEALADADMVFITAGMGGGTGTGASPIVAEIAKDIGALTVGIVTTPFSFEGPKRMQRAEEGIVALKDCVDTLICIPNQRLLSIVPKNTPLDAGFRYADEILYNATKGISDLITIAGLVNLDFADVRTVMSEMGDSLIGFGQATGENKARLAAEQAINSPLLEDVSISGAIGLLVNITGGDDMSLHEVDEAVSIINEEAGSKANLIFGTVVDKSLKDELRITVIATGLSEQRLRRNRIPGLNRVPYEPKQNSTLHKSDVPAIDRTEEIHNNMSHSTSANMDTLTKPQTIREQPRFEQPKIPQNGNGNGASQTRLQAQPVTQRPVENRLRTEQPQPKQAAPQHEYTHARNIRDLRDMKRELEELGLEPSKHNANGSLDDDLDVPACRRKKWNSFSL